MNKILASMGISTEWHQELCSSLLWGQPGPRTPTPNPAPLGKGLGIFVTVCIHRYDLRQFLANHSFLLLVEKEFWLIDARNMRVILFHHQDFAL